MNRFQRMRVACCAVVCCGLIGSGCKPSTGATVTGVLTIDGKVAPAGVRIDFEPQVKNGSTSTGYTDADGRFEMMFNVNKIGVMPGESLVKIWIEPTFEPRGDVPTAKMLQATRLPETVNIRSTLRKTVQPGANTIDLAIETKPAK